jgi:hypothetical protein
MSSFLYQTFYPYNKFDDTEKISYLKKWMLTRDVISQLFPVDIESITDISGIHSHIPIPSISPCEKMQFISPNKTDTLFWCIYISNYGEKHYLAIGNKYGNVEIAEKQKIMEFLKSNKNALKNHNRKITLVATQEVMSDLMTNTKTSIMSLVAFSVYYKKNIVLLNSINKTFLEYVFEKESNIDNLETNTRKWIVIQYTENKKYRVLEEAITDLSEYITLEYVRIESYDKPLKGISTYKMGELLEVASKIPEFAKEPKLLKPELYGKLWQYLLWV